ncbi:MAG TPA: glycosyltransferase [Solirubrobacteraceae bacterium]|jgi:glycosyltransferase involved in cell wall biosynthesis
MAAGRAADVLLVSLGSTAGLRRADDELADSLRRAGASVELARPVAPRPLPTLMLTDLEWARSARRAAREALERQGPARPPAVIYSTTTAALLWRRPGAIRFDALAASNRPGRHGLWQRPLERGRLREAPLLLPWSERSLDGLGADDADRRTLVLPVPVEPSGPLPGAAGQPAAVAQPRASAQPPRDIAAVTYAANPAKKGLGRVLRAWRAVRDPAGSDELVIAGVSREQLVRDRLIAAEEPGVRVTGPLPTDDFRALLRRACVFVCAPRREDYGIVQLEALADGCQLVTTAAPGPYAALPIARELDARLVGDDLAAALRMALQQPLADYAQRARAALAPFSRDAVDRIVADELLPRLLA